MIPKEVFLGKFTTVAAHNQPQTQTQIAPSCTVLTSPYGSS